MANTYKNLGQLAPASAALSTLYTVPGATSAIVSSLIVANRGTSTALFRVSHAVAGAADDPKQYIAWDLECPAGKSYVFTVGLTLAATDVLRVRCDTGNCSFAAYGQEVT